MLRKGWVEKWRDMPPIYCGSISILYIQYLSVHVETIPNFDGGVSSISSQLPMNQCIISKMLPGGKLTNV